jgi:arabinofuranosyltransferase
VATITEGTPADTTGFARLTPLSKAQVAQFAVLAAPVVLLAALAWAHRSMFDDGYIYLHVAQNILAGNGPVFNRGQRVEVFTGPLWTAILAVAGFVTPFPLEWIAVVLGIIMTLGGTTLAIFGSARLSLRAEPRAFLLPLGALVFIATYPVWSLASMGLETGLTILWLGTCLALLVRWSSDRRLGRLAMITLGLGPLVRPELLIDSAVFLLVVLAAEWSAWSWRDRVRLITWAAALPVIYQVFRMGYYGEVVANTAIAKEATLPRVGRGLQYLEDFVRPYWLFVPAVALVTGVYVPLGITFRRAGDKSRQLWAMLALPIAGVFNAAYITIMGGDYMHARLLLPAFFAVCAPVAVSPTSRRYVASLLMLPWALVAILSLRPPASDLALRPPFIFAPGHGDVTPAQFGWGSGEPNQQWFAGRGLYVYFGIFFPSQTKRIDLPPAPGVHNPTVATSAIGAESYALGTNVQILDLLGLADPLTAHLLLKKRGLTGHEKPLPAPWVAALLTGDGSSTAPFDDLQKQQLDPYITPLIPPTSGHTFAVQTAWARAALQCPTIHRIEYGQDGPLTLGRFVSNIAHAWGNSQLRIPANPETAYHQFCGPGTPRSVSQATGQSN